MPKNTKDKILEVAQNLITEKSYAAVSISEIADKVGITKSSIYHFFKNKESLYSEIITSYIENSIKIYSYQPNEKPSKKLLEGKIKEAIKYGKKHGNTLGAFESVIWSDENAKKIRKSFSELYLTLFETLRKTGINKPEFSVHLILDMSYLYIKKEKCGEQNWNTEEFTKLLIKHLYVQKN